MKLTLGFSLPFGLVNNMKQAFFVVIAAMVFSVALDAQTTETFDIATFQIPKGWQKQASENAFQISTRDAAAGTYCLITIYRSLPGTNDSKENFDIAWKGIVRETVDATAVAQMQQSNNSGDDWKAEMGSAAIESNGAKAVAVLVTVSGFGKMINTLIVTNSASYEPVIAAFLESSVLKKPDRSGPANAAPAGQPGANGAAASGLSSNIWKQSQSRKDPMGGYGGYSGNTYQFLANNTYRFSQVTFQNYAPKYYIEDEEGTYRISGNTITLKPSKASFRTYRTSRQEPVLKSGSIALEPAQYSFEIINLNNNRTLLLSPVNGVETRRDGTFSFWLNGEKRRTYSYNAVNEAGELILGS
jgi:hypothetical protein